MKRSSFHNCFCLFYQLIFMNFRVVNKMNGAAAAAVGAVR